jgi:hypothetical protein
VVDALCRRSSAEQVLAVSSCIPQWLDQVVASYTDDPQATRLISQLSVHPDAIPDYTLVNGVIRFKNRIWLGKDKDLQLQLLTAFYSSALGGHSGIPATYNKIKRYFFWSDMKADVQSFVKACSVCQQAKPDRAHYPGLL